MNIESLKIKNYRKFDDTDDGNVVSFSSKHDCNSDDKIKGFTLLVGKNNSGKTTIASALKFLFSDHEKIELEDINKNSIDKYLKELIENNFDNVDEVCFPEISFEVVIRINNDSASLNNFYDIVPFGFKATNSEVFTLKVIYRVADEIDLRESINSIIDKARERIKSKNGESDSFKPEEYIHINSFWKEFSKIYNDSEFKMLQEVKYNGETKKISLKSKFNIHIIKANKNLDASENEALKKSLADIIKKQSEELAGTSLEQRMIDDTQNLNEELEEKHGKDIADKFNSFAKELRSDEKLEVDIYFDIFKEGLSSTAINYVYKENGHGIKNDKFGLGYTNLFHIISEIIKYIEEIKTINQNKINLLFIEEPEAFMHPQLQVKFIKYIREALNTIIKGEKNLFLQTVISTHSSNIVKSKIESSNSFEYINILHSDSRGFGVSVLGDDFVIENVSGKGGPDEFKKKIMNYIVKKVCLEMTNSFFADLIILVEGDTENLLVNYGVTNDENYEGKYVQIFNVGGRHMTSFYNFFKRVNIPTLIITDLDLKDETFADQDGNCINQVTLGNVTKNAQGKEDNMIVTNSFVYNVMSKGNLVEFITSNNSFQDANIVAVTQNILPKEKNENTAIPTSFEEYILIEETFKDSENKSAKLIDIFKEIHPRKFEGLDFVNDTRIVQKKLSAKLELANNILFCAVNGELDFKLPYYIQNGLDKCNTVFFKAVGEEDES